MQIIKKKVKFNITFNACDIKDQETRNIMLMINLVTRIIIPFSLMIFCSIWLSITIFVSRKKIAELTNSQSNKTLIRDIKFSVTSICLNLVYILLNVPISLVFAI